MKMMQCSNPDCGLTTVDNDSMYRIRFKGDIVTEPYYTTKMTCKLCGAELK